MAKKSFGKFLLFTAAAGTAAAAVYYYIRKKEALTEDMGEDDDDYDDFSEDLDDENDTSSRNYVPLNLDGSEHKTAQEGTQESTGEADQNAESPVPDNSGEDFTPLSEQVTSKTGDNVEEFFDEDEDNGEEPPIQD